MPYFKRQRASTALESEAESEAATSVARTTLPPKTSRLPTNSGCRPPPQDGLRPQRHRKEDAEEGKRCAPQQELAEGQPDGAARRVLLRRQHAQRRHDAHQPCDFAEQRLRDLGLP
jgi:hypothetical protein